MADLGTTAIVERLEHAARGLSAAQDRLTAAGDYADRARARIVRNGFAGIARGMDTIRTAIDRADDQVGAILRDVGDQAASVGAVTDRYSPGEAAGALTSALAGIQRTAASCLAAAQSLADLGVLIRLTLAGGSPEGLLGYIDPARGTVLAVHRHLDTATTATRSALNTANEAGTAPAAALPAELARPPSTSADTGPELANPDDRAGTHIATGGPRSAESTDRRAARRAKVMQARGIGIKQGDGLAKEGAAVAANFRSLLNRQDPNYCVPLAAAHSAHIQPSHPQQLDLPATVGSVIDTGIFLADVVVIAIRKVRKHDR